MSGILKNRKKAFIVIALLSLVAFMALLKLAVIGSNLVYSDYTIVNGGSVQTLLNNGLYQWSDANFGYSVRYTIVYSINLLAALLSSQGFEWASFGLRIYAPFLACILSIAYITRRLSPSKWWIIPSIFYVVNPVIFGDFLTGQTLWAYAALPWVFYFWIKVFFEKKSSTTDALLLAVSLFAVYSILPPVIIPLFFILFLFYMLGFIFTAKRDGIRTTSIIYLKHGLLVGGIFLVFASPFIMATSSGEQSFTQSSAIRDYLHNYSLTNLENIMRLAGNMGNGQSTLGYNLASPTNAFGYFAFVFIILGLFIFKNPNADKKNVELILFTLVAIVIIFVTYITYDRDVGVALFDSQWMVAAIRNPTKIYIILLVLFTLLLGYALRSVSLKRASFINRALPLALLASILIYGWPIFHGDLGLTYSKKGNENAIRKDPVVADIINHSRNARGRSLIIPTTHQDEINYQNISPSLSAFKLGGALPDSSLLIKKLNESYNSKDKRFFSYLNALGVSNLYIKELNEKDSSTKIFSSLLNREEGLSFLQSGGLKVSHNTDEFTEVINDGAKPLIYSPSRIVNINTAIPEAHAEFLADQTTIKANTNYLNEIYSSYKVYGLEDQRPANSDGLAQVFSPHIVRLRVYLDKTGPTRRVNIYKVNPVLGSQELILSENIEQNITGLKLNNRAITLVDSGTDIDITSGELKVEFGVYIEDLAPDADLSFEERDATIGNASIDRSERTDVYGKRSEDVSDGRYSQLVGAKNGKAFIAKQLNVNADGADGIYKITFDYKKRSGLPGSYSIIPSGSNTPYVSDLLSESKNWAREEVVFQVDPDEAEPVLYMYSTSPISGQSEVLYDNIHLYKFMPVIKASVYIAPYESSYQVSDFASETEVSKPNSVLNSSFDNDFLSWTHGTVGASKSLQSSELKIDTDEDNKNFASLRSKDEASFLAQRVKINPSNRLYELKFSTRNIKGSPASYAIVQDGKVVANGRVDGSEKWSTFSTIFTTSGNSSLSAYLYSPSSGETTINLFDNITITPASNIERFLIKQSETKKDAQNLIQDYSRLSPTELKISIKKGDGLIAFNEAFHKGWQAELRSVNKSSSVRLSENSHILVNGYSNGWLIDNGVFESIDKNSNDFILSVTYKPQHDHLVLVSISGTLIVIIASCIIYNRVKKR